jgi:hypothetical protein
MMEDVCEEKGVDIFLLVKQIIQAQGRKGEGTVGQLDLAKLDISMYIQKATAFN